MEQHNPKIIFVCTGNSARSQMAEGLLRAKAGDQFEIYSAGTDPTGVNHYSVRAMQELGIDISAQFSKNIQEFMGNLEFDYVITVCGDAQENCPAVFLSQGIHLHWGFDDPARFVGSDEDTLSEFRRVRDEIEQKIQNFVDTNTM